MIATAFAHPVFRVLVVTVVLVTAFTLASEDFVFLSVDNAQNIAINTSQSVLLAVALALLLAAGEFDLSLGANLVLASVLGALMIQEIAGLATLGSAEASNDVAPAALLALLACIATGAAVGVVNGGIVAYARVNSLIGTLGTMGIAQGAALLITGGVDVGNLPLELQDHFGLARLAGIPAPALVAAVVALLAWAALRYTRFGMRTLAAGSSRVAAERSGVRLRPHVVALFALAGALCGLAGFIDIARFTSTTLAGHQLDALAAITAVVIGGGALAGGRVSIPGAVLGALLIVVLQVGLVVVGLNPFWQLIVIGAVLVVAVSLERYRPGSSAHA